MPSKLNIKYWDRYGRLVILWEYDKMWKERQFLCKCDCWNQKIILMKSFVHWYTKSCWCIHSEWNKSWKADSKHWMCKTRIYRIWTCMNSRCKYETDISYVNYWWRWIKVLWESFEEFYKDMWSSYVEWLEIDRIDNDGDYCKENCKWSTHKEQANHRRTSRIINHNWQEHTVAERSDILKIPYQTIRYRISKNKSII